MNEQSGDPPEPHPIDALVLVVDDEEANRESLARRLRRRGMTVDLAVDGDDALRRIAAHPYDLVMLDVMMPGLSGIDVLQRVRQTREPSDLPIIMATANDSSRDIAAALELGANDYITKPIDFGVALARIKTQLSMTRAVRQVLMLQEDLVRQNAKLNAAVSELSRSAERTRGDLELAARVQATFLPRKLHPDPRFRAEWRYQPCDQLAGDALNICPLDANHVAFYVLDVSGHGVASSLIAVTAARMLAPASDPASILVNESGPLSPADVMNELSHRFLFEGETGTGQFITCFYAVLDLRTGRLDYASAGHPQPIVLSTDGSARPLAGSGMIIGLSDTYEQQTEHLQPGDRVFIYSDGIPETMDAAHEMFGMENIIAAITKSSRATPIAEAGDLLLNEVRRWRGDSAPSDDVSLLCFEYGSHATDSAA